MRELEQRLGCCPCLRRLLSSLPHLRPTSLLSRRDTFSRFRTDTFPLLRRYDASRFLRAPWSALDYTCECVPVGSSEQRLDFLQTSDLGIKCFDDCLSVHSFSLLGEY